MIVFYLLIYIFIYIYIIYMYFSPSARSRYRAAAGSLTADRPGRRLLALVALCVQHCRARPRATSRFSRAQLMCGSAAKPLAPARR